jgi:HK97 family phage major capsid protein
LKKSSQPATFFDAMLAASVVARAGAKDDRPKGDWSAIPTVATVGELAWVDPNAGPINETSMTFGSRSRRPHLGVFSADITRVLRVSTGGLAEKVVLSTGARVLGSGLDKAAINGSGLDYQPRGILNSPISTTSGATFSTTTAAELIRLVEDVNAVPSAFIISPTVAKLLRTRPRFTSTDTPILSGGKISDLPVYVSTAMPDDQILLGDFSRLTICSEAIQLLVNPYKESHIGTLEITFYLFADTVLEYASAFAAATSVS